MTSCNTCNAPVDDDEIVVLDLTTDSIHHPTCRADLNAQVVADVKAADTRYVVG